MLRMENVRLIKDAVEIEVSTATADGGMKSENAHQPHLIECSATAALIRDFKKDRQKELAMPDDYLFGDPHQGHKTFQPADKAASRRPGVAIRSAQFDNAFSRHC